MGLNPSAKEWHPKVVSFPNPFLQQSNSTPIFLPKEQQQQEDTYTTTTTMIYHVASPPSSSYITFSYLHQTFPFRPPPTVIYSVSLFPPEPAAFETGNVVSGEIWWLKEGERALKECLKINGEEERKSFSGNLPPRLRKGCNTKWNEGKKKKEKKGSVCQEWRVKGSKSEGKNDFLSTIPSACSMTTVMIKNIPNEFRRKDFLRFLDALCRDHHLEYDFFYLPMDFRTHDNLGFAFVNFTTSDAALTFKKVLEGYEWRVFKTSRGQFLSNKICQLAWGRIQGKDALVKHFEKSCFLCENKNYLPVVYTPARNGFNSCSSKMTNVGRMQRELGLLSGC